MILAIASTRFPQTYDSHGQPSTREPKAAPASTFEVADTVQISSQARAAQASYRRVSESKKPAPPFSLPGIA